MVWAHPDDETYLAGGLSAALTDAGQPRGVRDRDPRRGRRRRRRSGRAPYGGARGGAGAAGGRGAPLAGLPRRRVRGGRRRPDGRGPDPRDRRRRRARHRRHLRAGRVHRPPGPPGRQPLGRPRAGGAPRRAAAARRRARAPVDPGLDEDYGVFELGLPRVCARRRDRLLLPLDGALLDRKVEALLLQESQTARLVAAVGLSTVPGVGGDRGARRAGAGDQVTAALGSGTVARVDRSAPAAVRRRARSAGAAGATGRPVRRARARGAARCWRCWRSRATAGRRRRGSSTRCGPTTRPTTRPRRSTTTSPACAATSATGGPAGASAATATACGSRRTSWTPTRPGAWRRPTRRRPSRCGGAPPSTEFRSVPELEVASVPLERAAAAAGRRPAGVDGSPPGTATVVVDAVGAASGLAAARAHGAPAASVPWRPTGRAAEAMEAAPGVPPPAGRRDRAGPDAGPRGPRAAGRRRRRVVPPAGRGDGSPARTSPMVGRQHDREEVLRLLNAHGVVTLTGPGGVGKTRLALDIAADWRAVRRGRRPAGRGRPRRSRRAGRGLPPGPAA